MQGQKIPAQVSARHLTLQVRKRRPRELETIASGRAGSGGGSPDAEARAWFCYCIPLLRYLATASLLTESHGEILASPMGPTFR